jgi:hypothetical protein
MVDQKREKRRKREGGRYEEEDQWPRRAWIRGGSARVA